jgi:hypothetical protein
MGPFLGQPARATNPETIDDMNVAWSGESIDDLARLRSYISENDPSAAQRVALYILHVANIMQFAYDINTN